MSGGDRRSAHEIQIAEVYDPFSFFQFPQLDRSAFVVEAKRQPSMTGGIRAGRHRRREFIRRDIVHHPIGVTGLVRIADAALQVMGLAGETRFQAFTAPWRRRSGARHSSSPARFWATTTSGGVHEMQKQQA